MTKVSWQFDEFKKRKKYINGFFTMLSDINITLPFIIITAILHTDYIIMYIYV